MRMLLAGTLSVICWVFCGFSDFSAAGASELSDSARPVKSAKKTVKKSDEKKTALKSPKKSKTEKASKSKNSKKRGVKEEIPEDTRTFEEKEADRMAHYRETGVWLWPELSPEQLEARAAAQKELLEKIKAAFPNTQLVYYESEHFYYLTDAPQPIAKTCLTSLEKMYASLCGMFGFPKDHQVWFGKCIVAAFVHQQNFLMFEQQFYGTAAQFASASGLAHQSSDGDVLVSTFYGDISTPEKQWKFIGTLVHETTHGFVHRYRARGELPLWLNEGIAEFMAYSICPADRQVPLKRKRGLEMMQRTGSVGGLLFMDQRIEVWQYGVASGMVEFLLRKDAKAFKPMIDEIKDGKPWQDALKDAYQWTPEEFLFAFGRMNRIPMLRP